MPALDAIANEKIAKIAAQHRLRAPITTARMGNARVQRGDNTLISFSCNDYLGLSHHPDVIAAAQGATTRYGTGAGASRLITGDSPLYEQLESALAAYKNTEASCVFGSGYLANIGAITALVGRGDVVIADKLVHACILDGIKLSGARLLRFVHNDAADCARLLAKHRAEHLNCLVITETVFSMDGDVAPLADLRQVCDTHDAWLMTDNAHGMGEKPAATADVQMGTLSKALGAYGGYICASQTVIDYLKTSARSLIFTTGLPPSVLASALAALQIMQAEPQRREHVMAHALRFTQELGLPEAQSAIVPLLLGGEQRALAMAKALEQRGLLVGAIRPPTVPNGASRLRIVFNFEHKEQDITSLVKGIKNECISN